MTSFCLCAKVSLSPRETPPSFLTPRQHFPSPREENTMECCPGHHMMVNAFHGDCPRGGISWARRASSNPDTSLHVWDSFSLCHHLYDSDPMAKVIQGPMSLSHLNYVLSMVLFFQVTWTQEGNLPCLGLRTTQDPLFPVQGERNPRKLSSGNDVGLDLKGEDKKNFWSDTSSLFRL